MTEPTGVLLAQVGTPEAPTPAAVKRYLANFLSDRRVVDYPAWLWQPLLRGVILPLRSRRSAKLYQRIWTPQGSPLLVESEQQRAKLQTALGDRYRVVLGMAYAGPSFERAFDDLMADGITSVIVVPMFPQYSSATTASVYDAAFAAATVRGGRARVFVPAVSCLPPYFDHPGYIAALCDRLRAINDCRRNHAARLRGQVPSSAAARRPERQPFRRGVLPTHRAAPDALPWLRRSRLGKNALLGRHRSLV